MLDIVIRVAAGIAGAAIFAAISNYFLMLSTGYWYLGGLIVFVAFFAIAYFVQRTSRTGRQTAPRTLVASRNKSGARMDIDVDGVASTPDGESLTGSENE